MSYSHLYIESTSNNINNFNITIAQMTMTTAIKVDQKKKKVTLWANNTRQSGNRNKIS